MKLLLPPSTLNHSTPRRSVIQYSFAFKPQARISISRANTNFIHTPAIQTIFAWFIPGDISEIFAGTTKHSVNEREELWVTEMQVPETQSGFLVARENGIGDITLLKNIDIDSFSHGVI